SGGWEQGRFGTGRGTLPPVEGCHSSVGMAPSPIARGRCFIAPEWTDQMIEWLHLAALLLYGVGAAITGVSFARGGRRLLEGAIVAVLLGLLMQGAAMLAFASRWGELPLVGLGASLSTLAFMIALGTVAVA